MSDDVVARAESPRGEVILRRRSWDDHLELRVNGVFVMDTRETSTEQLIATVALDEGGTLRAPADGASLRVLVGGLGLGFTLRELALRPDVGQLVVAEIEPALVRWHQDGLVPQTASIMQDPRVEVLVADVRDVVTAQPAGSLDVIILDVDNGPGFLVYDDNATIYQDRFLTACRSVLAPTGRLVVWSSDQAPRLHDALSRVFGSADLHSMAVTLGRRVDHYHAYVAPSRRLPEPESPCPAH